MALRCAAPRLEQPLLLLLLLLLVSLFSAVHALSISSASLTNASVGASTELLVSVDFQGVTLPTDAVFTITLHPDLAVTDGVSTVDTTLLAAQLDGSLQVATNTNDNALVVTRANDGSSIIPTGDVVFKLTHLTAPSVAGVISLGSLSVGNSTHAALEIVALPSLWIAPGAIWNSDVAFANLISGRATAFSVAFTPAHDVPINGFVMVHLPRLYSASSANLQKIELLGVDGAVDSHVEVQVVGKALRFSWNASASGVVGLEAMRLVVLRLNALQHPLLEGPIGRSVRIETANEESNVMDQVHVDVSNRLLEKATVLLTKRQVDLRNASDSGSYAVSLSVPPESGSGLIVEMVALVPDSRAVSTSLQLEPSRVTFSQSNWSEPVAITVRAAANYTSLPAGEPFLVSHAIVDAATEPSFATADNIYVTIYDDAACCVKNGTDCGRCTSCPVGSYCGEGSASPVECPNGTFSFENGARPCQSCPAGHSCTATDAVPVKCSDGSYSLADDAQCRLCEQGYHCPTTTLAPVECAQGFYSLAGATTCTACPFGYICNLPDTPLACAIGETNNRNHSECLSCPAGFECSPLKTIPTACSLGTFSLEGDGQCTTCPKGYECPVTTTAPIRCSVGSFAPAGSTECTACPAGSYCPQPSVDPIACPTWHYSIASSTACTPCPAGKDCSSASSVPVDCPSGTYSITQASPCTVCPAGSACAQLTAAPVACQPGTFSIGAQSLCTACAAGHYCPHTNQNTQLPCANGTYAESGATVCTSCPAGKQCPSTTQKIVQSCAVGTFSVGGQTQCTECPAGRKCPAVDGSQNAPCPLGTFSAEKATQCTSCPAGYACPDASAAPIPCVVGSYSTGGASTCTQCAPGFACPEIASSQRISCAAGTYSVAGAASCTPCPAGYACLFTNSSSFSPCSPGWYSPEGAAACLECPRGFYCDAAYEMPKNCSVGSYSLKTSTSCVPCDPGYECPRSDQLPQPCPVGYYSEGAVANCRACRPGYKCGLASTNPTPPEDACPMGGYCNPPTTFFLCPAGTYGNVTAGESVDQACAPCPEGYYCEMGSTPLTAQRCPTGFVCPIGTKRASQFPCPAGTHNPLPGQFGFDACVQCPAGSYCEEGSADPVVCPQGYFCLEGTGAADQHPCPAGTYSGPQTGLTVASQCQNCELGAYCPQASSTPTKCPAGTYNPETGSAGLHQCLDCPPGWACPRVGQFEYVDRCAKGHFCPSGTVVATANPCPAGSYTERIDLIRAEDCTICPLRHACPQGTGGETQTMLDCGAGFFCPNGTAYAKQFPCLPGTWSSSTSLADASECDICPVGRYCSGGKSYIDGDCSPGHYCPLATPSPTKFPCPAGTYTAKTSLFEPSQCDDCPPGYYCPAGSIAPQPCKPGSYTSLNNTKSVGPGAAWPECVTCPAGYFCIDASVAPVPCGNGNFSPKGAKSCSKCEPGYFCNSNTTSDTSMRMDVVSWLAPGSLFGKCYNGTYCALGTDHEPALEIDACPRGYFCPKATPAPVICPAGTYSNLTGQDEMSDCIPTPAGFFSLAGALQPTGKCDAGFYCPERSTSRMQVPCPARYYLDRAGGQSEEDCAVCVAGAYCPRGSAYPVACPTGFYCRTGVATPEPCPIGTYSNATGIKQVEDCLLCPPGMYCDSTGLTVPRGPCDPGYFCTLGSYTSAPMNYETTLFGVTNRNVVGQCPRGSYCPLGSALPSACPPGTYNNFTGLETETQCVLCPPGKYCETPGLFLPTGDCFSGYYCTGAASTPTQVATPVGHFTGNGSTAPVPCPAGQFNSYAMQEQCVDCPAGFFCGSPGTIRPTICPAGSYCPKATALAIKCPPGTFSDKDGLIAILQCQSCPAGFFCDSFGLIQTSGKCFEGFVCTGGSPVSNPVNADFGFVCPVGHYCPVGSGAAIQCPPGSFRPSTGGTALASCTLCPGGSYCGGSALTAPSGLCSEGYYCTLNASSATPTDNVTGNACPLGFYCPEGTMDPIKCAAGSYASTEGSASCVECPQGFFCDGVTTDRYFDCPAGYYCPLRTGAVQFSCPIGSFSASLKLVNASQCEICTPGSFCDSEAITTPTGLCSEGYFCPAASQNAFGRTLANATHPCPRGSYCPQGTYVPTPCPLGTFSNTTALAGVHQCTACAEGMFCGSTGLTAPSGPCDGGYFCRRGNAVSTPSSGVATVAGMEVGGDLCPTGSFCPQGSAQPRPCPEGTYADERGASVCTACPAGFFCPLGSSSYASNACPQGYFCPVGTKRDVEFPCLPGTFGNRTGLQDVTQCTPAPGGTYIEGFAAVKATGLCKSGFYCSGGSASSTPAGTSATGGPCLPGTNCPEGSAVPIVCDAGFYCSSTNTDRALPCDPGFYCVQGSYTANPTGQNNSLGSIGDVCSRGHYCPQGTSNPIPCPPGTFSENTQNSVASQCFPCPPGFLCSVSGIVTPYEKCPAGYICTGGEREVTQRCPKGSECPEQSSAPKICPAGTFSDEEGLAMCKLCPERYYCEAGTVTPVGCPVGFFCPLQTPSATKYPCPPGSFSNTTLLASGSECAACPPGKFCSGAAPTNQPTGDCAPRHFCAGRAVTATPTDGVTGDLCAGGYICTGGAWLSAPIDGVTGSACQPGYYCPRGSSSPIRCAKGTYNSLEAQPLCVSCPTGGYCDTNATMPVPCPLRYYCPEGTVDPVLCPSGTYGHTTGLESAEQCAACSAGNYCVGGTVTASCAAGYYCKLYNLNPNPALTMTVPAIANKSTGFDFGGPCPIGHYCPEGVLDPIPCPNTTARLETHGTSVDDCGPCPAGWSCENGALTVPCPTGYYCTYAQSAIACPQGTYNPTPGQARLEDCKACDAGKLCNRTAIVELTDWFDCPIAHYCPEATIEPVPCPAGRFRRDRGATSVLDCTLCPGGSYCEIATIEPTLCESQVHCPVGSGEPIVCPGGSYCPTNSTAPLQCPAGFYCAIGVSLPTACERGFYCPPGSVAPLACPLGYIGRKTPLNGVLSRLTDACESCPAGSYGIDPNRTICEPCIEGYVCLEATRASHPKSLDADNGYPCPPGYYCPPSSSRELPCPSGSYQPSFLATNSSACLPCPENSYQNANGQPSCLPCSKSAYAGVGATKCTCKGSYRAFQMSDGYCICEPGYEFYDQDMILRSDEDDDVDCQPIVYDRCGSNQVRSHGGGCVASSQLSCENSCGTNSSGTLVSSLGICQCDRQTDVDTVCDKKCRDSAMQVRVSPATGELELYDPVTGAVAPLTEEASAGVISKVSCSSDSASGCQLHSVSLSASGFAGSYDIPSGIAASASAASSSVSSATARQRQRRRLEGAPSSIGNPMVCLPVGQGILFDLSTPGSYPIYMKDSMLNTNPNFDYGAFRALATRVKSNASTVSAFAFSFTGAGIYVFGNSLNGAAKTVISVMKTGTSCPTEAAIMPMSEKNLIAVSVRRRTDDMILAPDWGLIVGLLCGLIGMVAAVIAGLYYFRTKSWATSSFRKRIAGYRATSKSTDLATMHSKGAGVVNSKAQAQTTTATGSSDDMTMKPSPVMVLDDGSLPSLGGPAISSPRWAKSPMANKQGGGGYEPDLGRWGEEDVDLRELVDRLQYHHEAVTKCFDDQKGDVQKLMQHLQSEANELKRLFVNSLTASTPFEVPAIQHQDPELHPESETLTASLAEPQSLTARRVPTHSAQPADALLVETLERDLAERERFRRRRNAGMDEIAGLLKTVENWSRNPTEFAHNLIDNLASSGERRDLDHARDEPETTSAPSYLEHVQSVLGDLKTLLCSDPSTVTSSSVLQFAEAEKVRREVGEIVVEAAARRVAAVDPSKESAESKQVEELLALHERIVRGENKEDEILYGQLASLQRFGDALPKLLAAVDDMESELKHDLAQVREEQNPSKERAVSMAMEEKLGKFLRELSKGAGRLHDKVQKEQVKLNKAEKVTLPMEQELENVLQQKRKKTRELARLAEAQEKAQAEARAAEAATVAASRAVVADEHKQAAVTGPDKDGDALLGQIKDLLATLSQQQQQQQPMQHLAPTTSTHAVSRPVASGAVSSSASAAVTPVSLATTTTSSIPPLQLRPAAAVVASPSSSLDPQLDQEFQFSTSGDMALPPSLDSDELDALRHAAEAEAQALLARQESMRAEYAAMLRDKFPQLSGDETQRLLDEFSADLLRMGSSQSIEAQKTQEDVKNLLTARAVMAASREKAMQATAQQHHNVMQEDQRQQTTSLESKFAKEEDEIEQEYQRELARLEQEFAVLGETQDDDVDDVDDDDQGLTDRDKENADDGDSEFDGIEGEEGDASAPTAYEEDDEHDRDNAAANEAFRLDHPRVSTNKVADGGREAKVAMTVTPSGSVALQVDKQVDLEIARVRDAHAAAVADRLRALDDEAAQRQAQLQKRLRLRHPANSHSETDAKQHEEEEEAALRVIAADITDRKLAVAAEAAAVEMQAVSVLTKKASDLVVDVDEQIHACQAAHATELERLRQQLTSQQAQARANLKARLDQKRRVAGDGETSELAGAEKELDQQLAAEELQQIQQLQDQQADEMQVLMTGLTQRLCSQIDKARLDQASADAELERVRDDHARARAALSQSLAAERSLQEARLRERLAARRNEKKTELMSSGKVDTTVVTQEMQELDRDDAAQLMQLAESLDHEATEALRSNWESHRISEMPYWQRATDAMALVKASEAAKHSMESAFAEAAKNTRLAFDSAMTSASHENDSEARSRRLKLLDRLAARRSKTGARAPPSDGNEDHNTSASASAVRDLALATALDGEIAKTHDLFDRSRADRERQLELEAANQKRLLKERIAAAKKRVASMPGDASTQRAQLATLQAEEDGAVAQIDSQLLQRKSQLAHEVDERQKEMLTQMETGAIASADGVERLLAICRADHEKEALALRERLVMERRKEEASLKERLARRRQERLTKNSGSVESETLGEEENQESNALEQELAKNERRAEQELQKRFMDATQAAFAETTKPLNQQAAARKSDETDAEAELRRVQEKHARDVTALQSSLQADRTRRTAALQERLDARRRAKLNETKNLADKQRLSKELDQAASEELAKLNEELTRHETEAMTAKIHEQQVAEEEAFSRSLMTSSDARAAQAAQEAMRAMAAAELDRLRRELDDGKSDARSQDAQDAALRKQRLQSRLEMKRRGRGGAHETEKQVGGQQLVVDDIRTVSPSTMGVMAAAMADAMDGAIDAELQRIRDQHAADARHRDAQLLQEAELRKAQLRDRMARKKAAMQILGGDNVHLSVEQLEVEEAAALQAIDEATKQQRVEADARAVDQETRVATQAEDSAIAQADDVEALLAACRSKYDGDVVALRERLALERQQREQMLQDRLSRKRAQRLAALETGRQEAGIPLTAEDEQAMEAELVVAEQHERAALDEQSASNERAGMADLHQKHRADVDQIAQRVEEEGARRRMEALAERERAEAELRRVQEEHERERRALEASLIGERKRQQQKLQDKLNQRRATRTSSETPLSQEEITKADAEDTLEMLQLETELDARGERALQEEHERQTQVENEMANIVSDASAKVAASEAARLAMEAAREAELRRVAAELETALGNARADDAESAAARKARLEQRLQAKKQQQQHKKAPVGVKEARATDPQQPISDGEVEKPVVDTRLVASEAMGIAVDDEVERIKKQYAESLQRRVDQLQVEGAARKALLRERMEQKRKALAMRSASANAAETAIAMQQLDEEENAEQAEIGAEVEAKTSAAEAEMQQQQAAVQATLHAAAQTNSDELERLLADCQAAHANEAEALRRAMAQERMRQEQALRDRLAKRRNQKLMEIATTSSGDNKHEEQTAAIEKQLKDDEERELAILAQSLADGEHQRLEEAEQTQQRQMAELMERAEQQARERQLHARDAQTAAELELQRVQDEHARELLALQSSLDGERRRQEQKLQDKLNARRAQRQQQHQQAGGQEDELSKALDAEDVLERAKLEEELQQRAAQAIEEERRRQAEQEQALNLQVAQAAAVSAAAEAAKRATEAARQAEIDRIAAEFEATRRRAMEDDSVDAQARRAKLEERLAEKRRRAKPQGGEKKTNLVVAAAKRVASVSRNIRAITESQAEKEITRLQGEHAAACQDRFAALEQDAALRKARLAERIAKKRQELQVAPVVSTQSTRESDGDIEKGKELEQELTQELEAESKAIDDSVALEKQRIAEEVTRAQEQMSLAVQEAALRNAKEMEQLLLNCKQTHDEESKNLQRALELERQRQEQALQERIAKRKQQRKKPETKASVVAEPTASTVSETVETRPSSAEMRPSSAEVRPSSAEAEANEERERRELEAALAAKEAEVWEEMRRKQEEELLSLTRQAESAALKKQEEAKMVQESAQVELDRLKKEHESEMASLTASLEVEQKRQQQQLQQRIAARRSKQQKQQKDSHDDAEEKERLAQVLEEQEKADQLALEQQMQAEIARKIDEERERQRQQEAELAQRIARANADAAAADATRRAMDLAREVELERVAKEFDEKSRELHQSHMTDLMNQKQKLEARVAAKKKKKLMELETKRELERQKLKEKQAQEELAAQSEQQRAQESVDDALLMAAGGGDDNGAAGDASAPPTETAEPDAVVAAPAASEIEETKKALMKKLEESRQKKAAEDAANAASSPIEDDESTQAAQQARDVAAIQQLFDNRVVPGRMPLLAAVELVLSHRHQKETSLLFAQQYKRKTQAIRDVLRDVMQQKATAKARLLRTNQATDNDKEARLKELDAEYDARIRALEQECIQAQEHEAASEAQRLKERQLSELQFLLDYFSGLNSAAAQRLQQEESERLAQMEQAAKLRGMLSGSGAEDAQVAGNQPRRLRVLGESGNDDMDDRINDLCARLQLQTDERIQQLLAEKHAELQRLQSEMETNLRRISDEYDAEATTERAAMEAAYQDRVRLLKSDSPQRTVLNNQKEAQIASLLLMLQGRRAQQQTRAKRLLSTKLKTIEHEYERKIQIVTAKMLQMLVEEKELLRNKKRALDKSQSHRNIQAVEEAAIESNNPLLDSARIKVGSAAQRATLLVGLSPRVDVKVKDDCNNGDETKEQETVETSAAKRSIERRLSTIEAMLRTSVDAKTTVDETVDEPKMAVDQYRQSVAQAIENVCQWHAVVDAGSGDGTLRVVEREAIDQKMQAQLDFANALVLMMASRGADNATSRATTSATVEHVVVADSLPTVSTKQGVKSTVPTYYDPVTRTLFVQSRCFTELSVGQLTLLLVHSMAQTETQMTGDTDVADPQFIGHVYRLLVQCYESLFIKSQQQQQQPPVATRMDSSLSSTRSHSATSLHTSSSQSTAAVVERRGRWKSHVHEMESFLSGLDTAAGMNPSDSTASTSNSSSTQSPRAGSMSPLRRQATAVMTALSMARNSSRFLLTSKDGANEMEALVVHERRQFLLEKLDTAEKLYAHVLRQYQEQKESLEYMQEMLAEEQEHESSNGATLSREDKTAHGQRLEELHQELEAVQAALDKTRRERDELFAQCQSLRDELEQLPRSRPTTVELSQSAPEVAEAKTDL